MSTEERIEEERGEQVMLVDQAMEIRPVYPEWYNQAYAIGCYCPLDQPCHVDVLIELIKELRERSQ